MMMMMMSQAMATTEEFSFPTTSDLYPCSIDSPPLWRLSPAASPDVFLEKNANECSTTKGQKDEEEVEDQEEDIEIEDCFPYRILDKKQERKSSSSAEKGSKTTSKNHDQDDDEEEKMDMLWENFNEDLPSRRSRSSTASRTSSVDHMVESRCGEATALQKLSRNNAASVMFSQRKSPAMLVFMRVLKKLFLLHNHHNPQPSFKHRS